MRDADQRKLSEGLSFALEAHGAATRKGKQAPYVSHLLQVAGLVLEHGGDTDQAVAGLLHDTIEDCAVEASEIRERFGERVADIVVGCTDLLPGDTPDQKSPWKERKTRYIDGLRAKDHSTRLVAACDKLHNLWNLVTDLRADGPACFELFNASPRDTLWYYTSAIDALDSDLPEALQREARALLAALQYFVDQVADTALPSTLQLLIGKQRRWALSRGVALDPKDRTTDLSENLFETLSDSAVADFRQGSGGELGEPDKPGDMYSVRSSSALVCNVFEYWRERDVALIARACGADPGVSSIHFEARFPVGLGGAAANLDVLFEGDSARPTAVESKFTETYSEPHNGFRERYFTTPDLWGGLPRSEALARSLDAGEKRYKQLGAAQLLKHALGLRRRYGIGGFRLLYLWFETPSPEALRHKSEIDDFMACIEGDFEVDSLTYQDLFLRVSGLRDAHPEYWSYLYGRYFS